MTVLSSQTIRRLQPLSPLLPRTQHKESGCSFGLSACGYDIRLDQDVTLRPGEFSLGSAMELFDMPKNVVGIVHDKSTWIRRGLCVFNTVVEPGWRGYLTLELKNVNQETYTEFKVDHRHKEPTLRLVKGTPIAQVIFSFLDEESESPYEGKYQDQERGPVAAKDGTSYL